MQCFYKPIKPQRVRCAGIANAAAQEPQTPRAGITNAAPQTQSQGASRASMPRRKLNRKAHSRQCAAPQTQSQGASRASMSRRKPIARRIPRQHVAPQTQSQGAFCASMSRRKPIARRTRASMPRRKPIARRTRASMSRRKPIARRTRASMPRRKLNRKAHPAPHQFSPAGSPHFSRARRAARHAAQLSAILARVQHGRRRIVAIRAGNRLRRKFRPRRFAV